MIETFNFHDAWFVVESNWVWMLVALALGIWSGWVTTGSREG